MLIDKKMIVFMTVAESCSYSLASRKLSLGQSVLSHHVDTLEKELKVSLFCRKGRNIELTPEGEVLYQEGKKLLTVARQTEDSFSTMSNQIARKINLAGDALTCSFTLPWMLAEFKKQHEDVNFTFKHLCADDIIDGIIAGDVDMALVGHPLSHRRLTVEPCFHDEIILVGSATQAPKSMELGELKKTPIFWITNDHGLDLLLRQKLKENGIPVKDLNVFMEVEELSILKTFIKAGVGYAFVPRLSVEDEIQNNALREIEVKGLTLERVNYRMFLKTKHTREIVSEFIEFIRSSQWGDFKVVTVEQ
ncbi:MAG: LysR family transcriptional regulator [Calditrichaeota bacterium]|jgi:LysR family transcriptional regulator, transcriptional activator of the cysJI operon|nr:LysR family transcriptional regulator [Calditrichota bacterium]MBT7617970.1 LysR family transcriptional regulator [Calditrichota bacterium]MBT7788588.1 LysR family transcriptional regulator [Calditrichota bacterium]